MPRIAINNGALASSVLTIGIGATAEYTLWNHTGTTLTVTFDNQANIAVQVHDDSGHTVDAPVEYKLGVDQTVHFVCINGDGVATQDLQLDFKGAHGNISSGTRHTPASTNFPGVFIGTI